MQDLNWKPFFMQKNLRKTVFTAGILENMGQY